MEMSTGVSLLRTAQSLLTGRTIQRTDGCTEVLWLVVQTHHIICCSHKRYKNRHFNQHKIFRYCEEGSGEPVQTCRLPRAFAASTRDLDIYYIVQWLCLRKCADSPEYSLLAWITHKSPFKAQTWPSKCADSPKPSLFAWMTPKNSKRVSQSQTANKPMAMRGISTHQSRDTRKTN